MMTYNLSEAPERSLNSYLQAGIAVKKLAFGKV